MAFGLRYRVANGMHQTRRRFLKSAAVSTTTGSLLGMAGCLGNESGGGGGDSGDTGGDANGGGGLYGGGGDSDTETSPTATDAGMTAGPTVAVTTHPIHGDILTDGGGNTLYLFTPDSPGESTCTDGCAEAWPPLTVDGEAGLEAGSNVPASLGTIERNDGSLQVTANDTPLYYFVQDESRGDANGQEVNNAWFVLRPDATPVTPTVSVREHADLGPILTDADGMTLYLFTNDESSASNCTGDCADAWPPLEVDENGLIESVRTDVELGTTEHPEVGTMATAAGHPLYYYAQDEAPGDATGQGVGGVWYVLDPEGTAVGG